MGAIAVNGFMVLELETCRRSYAGYICKKYDVIDAIDVQKRRHRKRSWVRNAWYTERKMKPSTTILQFISTSFNQSPGKNRKRMAKPPKILCCHPDVSPGFFFFFFCQIQLDG